MEIKEEFQKTEFGVIPSDWGLSELNALANVIDSLHQTPKFIKNGYAMVRVTDIKSGNLNLENAFKVSQEIYFEFIRNYKPKKGDIVLSRVGSYGVASFVDTEEPFCMGQNTVVIEPKINNKYLYYILNSTETRKQVENGSFGSGYKSLSLKNIKELKLAVPPREAEQTAITSALSDTDKLIAELEKQIAKKRMIKQGVMQELLKSKDGWEVKKLGEVAEINMGQSPDSQNYNLTGEGIPLIQGNADIENRKSIMRVWTKQITKTCKKGDLIMTVRAPVGAIGIASENSCIGRGVCSFKVSGVEKKFLYHLLIFKETDWKILEQGSTFTSANSNQIFGFELPIPKDEMEQSRIAQILSEMDAEIEALEKKLNKYKMLKQGMMESLLTGKIRLVKPKDIN